ncbi:putative Ig domain-containing protein, partial [Rhizobium lusitanum]|uniref:putative Ig domain-containing protein n=1 Tax=Rhizobium lusitanum TaxID=293958 RepID=UPI001FF06553
MADDGSLSGVPNEAGVAQFTVTATDSTGQTASQSLNISVAATPTIVVSPERLLNVRNNSFSGQSLAAVGGREPYRFEVTGGALPPGMQIQSGGIFGIPRGAGTYDFTITATDSSTQAGGPFAGSKSYSLIVEPNPPRFIDYWATVLAGSSDNPIYPSNQGGSADSVSIVTQPAHGTAHAMPGGGITYTPSSGYSGPDSFVFTGTNIDGTSAPATVNVTVNARGLVLAPAGGALPDATINTRYATAIRSSGGLPGYHFSIGGALPPGLALNPFGDIEGTPTIVGTYNFSVTATDTADLSATGNYSITVATTPGTLNFTPAGGALSEAMAGEAYSQQISASGGTGTKIYSLASGSLPNG